MTNKEKMRSLLIEASKAVCGDRHADYGDPAENHERTAEAWCWYLKHRCIRLTENGYQLVLDGYDACAMMNLAKVSRDIHHRKLDNLVDICGYAANAATMLEEPTQSQQQENEAYAEIAS